MAVHGRKFKDSLSSSSDDYYDFPCSPCARDGKAVQGMKHCVDCDENMCLSCIKDHNKFPAMKCHQILDNPKTPSGQRQQLFSLRCVKHGEKLIEFYCPRHDSVGCSACVTTEHSSCRGIKFIPDVSKGISKSNAILELQTTMSNMHARFTNLKQRKEADQKILKSDKVRIQKEIQVLRKQANDQLDEMERKLLDEVDSKFKENMQKTDSSANIIDEALAGLSKSEQKLKDAENNESEVFVLLKTDFANLKQHAELADQMENSDNISRLKLEVDKGFQTFLETTVSIGRLSQGFIPVQASLLGTYNIRRKKDKTTCEFIKGICITAEGSIIMTDYCNKRLKKLDNDYNFTSMTDLPAGPFGVCSIEDKQFAVTLLDQKKVQLVSNTEPMALVSKFAVGDSCRGITYKNGLLYVCCGGSKRRHGEGPGHIEIYNSTGIQLTSYYESLEQPYALATSRNGRLVYVLDEYQGLTVMNEDGSIVSRQSYAMLDSAGGICVVGDDKLCIGGRKSNNVVVVSGDGQFQQELLTHTHGIECSYTLCYDEKRSRLLVSMYNTEKIHVFQLNT